MGTKPSCAIRLNIPKNVCRTNPQKSLTSLQIYQIILIILKKVNMATEVADNDLLDYEEEDQAEAGGDANGTNGTTKKEVKVLMCPSTVLALEISSSNQNY